MLYARDGWSHDSTINNVKFEGNSTIIAVEVSRDWEDIGEGWKRRPGSNTKVRMKYL